MTVPYWTDGSATIWNADALALPLPDSSVDLICTSPPYFGLRAYQDNGVTYPGQIGSEATPAEFVDALIAATREMVRVLKPSGSIWINLGDKYAVNNRGSGYARERAQSDSAMSVIDRTTKGRSFDGIREKSLIGIPWRYALRCIDDLGLILRAEIIWSKPNGLPESVTDRVRRSHENWFHFTKEPRYYSAVDEVREPHLFGAPNGAAPNARQSQAFRDAGQNPHGSLSTPAVNPLGKLPGSVWTVPTQPLRVPAHLGIDHFAAFPLEFPRRIITGWSPRDVCVACGEGRRPVAVAQRETSAARRARLGYNESVAAIPGRENRATPGQSITHLGGHNAPAQAFAITGYVCACTPYTDHEGTGDTGRHDPITNAYSNAGQDWGGRQDLGARPRTGAWREYHFDRWAPAATAPGVVLDPFMGTGTTLLAATVLGRDSHGVDLSSDYCRLGKWRINDPGEIARAMQVEKPEPVIDGQTTIFDEVSA